MVQAAMLDQLVQPWSAVLLVSAQGLKRRERAMTRMERRHSDLRGRYAKAIMAGRFKAAAAIERKFAAVASRAVIRGEWFFWDGNKIKR